jgi:signal transduction histidine kinase
MLPLLAVAVISLLAVALIGGRIATYDTRTRLNEHLRGVAEVLTTSNFPLTEPVLRKMRNLAGAQFVLAGAAGEAVVSTLPIATTTLLPQSHLSGPDSIDWANPVVVAGQRYLHSSLPYRQQRGGAELQLHILFPYREFQAAWRSAFLPPLVVGTAAVLAIAVVAHFVAARISHVVQGLGGEVRRLAEGDFSHVELPSRDDELRDLALAVNQTAVRLAEYEQQVRRTEQLRTVAVLGAGLAHEIRNAATGCRMAVDLHAEGCPIDHDDQTLAIAKQQLYLMESRLQRFLELGKKPAQIDKRPVDFGQLVEDTLAIVRPAARHAGVVLDWCAPEPPVMFSADADMLGQAIVNLVLNAIEAAQRSNAQSAAEGRVVVRLAVGADQAELIVCDSGGGPQNELSGSLFEPFVTSKPEGVGLGLAVVKQVVDAHGGSIHWNREAGLTRFHVRVPLGARELSHV